MSLRSNNISTNVLWKAIRSNDFSVEWYSAIWCSVDGLFGKKIFGKIVWWHDFFGRMNPFWPSKVSVKLHFGQCTISKLNKNQPNHKIRQISEKKTVWLKWLLFNLRIGLQIKWFNVWFFHANGLLIKKQPFF